MGRPTLEVADIFRAFGPAWRWSQREHLSLGQLKVMSAIEQCRSAALGGHVLLQFLPQSPLPEVSGQGGTALVGSPSGRPASGGVLPRGLYPAGADQRHRLHQQGGDLSPVVRGGRRNARHHRGGSETFGRADRGDAGPAHLGVGADASSPRARDRPRRGSVPGRRTLGPLLGLLVFSAISDGTKS